MKKLTKNQRAEVIEALVANCNCSKEDAEVFNEMEDQTLVGLLAPVINAMDTSKDEEDQDEDQETDETNNEDDGVDMTGDDDAEGDLDSAESSSRSGYGTLKAGGTGSGRPGKGEENKKKAGIDNQRKGGKQTQNKEATVPKRMTMNEFLAVAPAEFVETWNEAESNKKQMKTNLIKTILTNEGNTFRQEWLMTQDIPFLRGVAKIANNGRGPVQQNAPMFNYEGAAGGAVQNSGLTENDQDDMYIPETLNYAEMANLPKEKMRRRSG